MEKNSGANYFGKCGAQNVVTGSHLNINSSKTDDNPRRLNINSSQIDVNP
jgi:hypothetical protein